MERTGTVLDLSPRGAYLAMTLRAPWAATGFRPGQFVALAVGGPHTSMVLRRCFSVYAADAAAGTVEFVFAVAGKGTAWLAGLRPGDTVDVVGPLGRPFPVPDEPGEQVLVGGGYGSAPMFALADALRAVGSTPHLVLGAATADRLFAGGDSGGGGRGTGEDAPGRFASVTVTTDDGTVGVRGVVTDPLPDLLDRTGARDVYACGPMGMLAACTAVAAAHGARAHTAVEESMACGVGVCMTCVLPVVGDDGITRMTRSCTEGPVFDGTRVRWADVGTVPADTLGAGVH
ncbi:MAG TPA: dihydroorotate dehydrogenase electron transfer subunit [Streptosporangiales bacterium]